MLIAEYMADLDCELADLLVHDPADAVELAESMLHKAQSLTPNSANERKLITLGIIHDWCDDDLAHNASIIAQTVKHWQTFLKVAKFYATST